MTHPIEIRRLLESRALHDFGLQNREGRAFGARVDLFTVELRSDRPSVLSTLPDGIYYTFDGRVILGDEPFGNGRTMLRYFGTRTERGATVAQYLHYARERIRKRVKQEQLAELRAARAARDAAAAAKRRCTRAIREEAAALAAAALIARMRSGSATG